MDRNGDTKEWDIFISHASEDKVDVARPLAVLLASAGLKIWLDENELRLGDSLREKIDHGLANSRYGIVVLSRAFFAKDWPQRELDGLMAQESRSQKVLLPVWHDINQRIVAAYSPILADRLAVSTSRGLDNVALDVLRVVHPDGSALNKDEWNLASKSVLDAGFVSLYNPSSLVGTDFEGYRLLKVLGTGGSGVVFLATGATSANYVAVKLFYPLPLQFASFESLFEQAFRAIRALNHRNIVRTLDIGETEFLGRKSFFLVMEYIQWKPLDEWSRGLGHTKQAFARRIHVAIELTNALQAAHDTRYFTRTGLEVRGILHGDIKPSNILVSPESDVKLLDFMLLDIRRSVSMQSFLPGLIENRYDQTVTEAFGTPGYMAPEQSQRGLLTIASDVYSLGITFSHLFFPYEADPVRFVLNTSSIGDTELITLISSMVSDAPAARPNSMRGVSRKLRSV